MKIAGTIVLAFLLIVTQVSVSCKKEYSCEDCVEIGNRPPLANAGPDQLIDLPVDSVMLDGSGSSDPDGSISEWLWVKISGPASFTFTNIAAARTRVFNLTVGDYEFVLRVMDNGGLTSSDTLIVKIRDPIQTNQPPVAKAGPDQSIRLPVNSGSLDGRGSSDPDNNITQYLWTRVSGPVSYNISNPNSAQSAITTLVEGIYEFELKVTDAEGLFSKDTVLITVLPPQLPCTDCKIVFVSDRDGNEEIYSANENGMNIHRLTYSASSDNSPAWSPDGTRIAFVSDRNGQPEIYIMNSDGSNLVRTNFLGLDPAWSPDGAEIVFSGFRNGNQDLLKGNVSGGLPTLLFSAPGYEGFPAWSPDGMRIAFTSDWMAYDFVYDIYKINNDGTGFHPLTGNILLDSLDYMAPRWSPNGTRIALLVENADHINSEKIGVMNIDGSGLNTYRSDAAAATRTAWSADGTRIIYTSITGSRKDVSWVSADGTAWGTIIINGWNADWQH